MTVDFRLAIPSYHRPQRIGETVLPYLAGAGMDMSRVTVFLTDESEVEAYAPVLARFGVAAEAGHGVGIMEAQNHIARAYPKGTPLVRMDDDVQKIVRRVDSKTLVPVTDMPALIEEGFAEAHGGIWSVWPSNLNPFYMTGKIRRTGLMQTAGPLFGYTVQHAPHEISVVNHGEDYARSIQFFEAMGYMTRLDAYTPVTAYLKEPGGMQDTRTPQNMSDDFDFIVSRGPQFAYRADKPALLAKGIPNMRLRSIRVQGRAGK